MNQIALQLKRIGKKKIKQIPIALNTVPQNLQELIEACVRSEVIKYNEKREGEILLSFLNATEIQEQSEKGKIGFGDMANKMLAQEETAIENVLIAFKDGLFIVFIDDDELTDLETPVKLTPESTVSFIRMTFLAGAYW